ncbi:hypothetical protein WJX84_010247 [Apatococcus fuscideae]|uniref:Uncharacterized protein n=1 Tax=Apatococcus fuscideae TaxID=2026836 RepID=A0AAW1SW26_9CHLO
MPRSFATIASRAAEEVYLCTDSYASPHFATQEPWRGPFLPGDMCARLELPWPPDLFESVSDMREGLPMSRTVQLQHLAFPMAPSTAFQVVPWDSRCVRTLRSLRLDVRPVGGLQDCWSQGVGGLTGLTKLVIIGAKPIEMYGRYHMKVMGRELYIAKTIRELSLQCREVLDDLNQTDMDVVCGDALQHLQNGAVKDDAAALQINIPAHFPSRSPDCVKVNQDPLSQASCRLNLSQCIKCLADIHAALREGGTNSRQLLEIIEPEQPKDFAEVLTALMVVCCAGW